MTPLAEKLLTIREIDALLAYAKTGNRHEAAVSMEIADQTLDNHLGAAFRKLEVDSALEAFRQGRPFGLVAATGMRDFAIGVFACTLLKLVSGALMSVVLSWNAPSGQKQLAISVSSDMLLMLLVGAVLTLVGWALTEAAAIAEENAQFI